MKNKIKIITPFYNPGEFLERCIASLTTQRYDNYQMIFVDDCSTDGSWDKLPHNDERAIIYKTPERKTALENIHDAIMNHCDSEDICITVDGDDALLSKNVLSYINDFYNENQCFVMYGQAIWSDGRKGFAAPYTKEEFKNLRKSPFKVSHIRTFRAGIYHQIKNQDPEFTVMKDKNGNFYKSCYDVPIIFSVFELAGYDKVKYNDKTLYYYNFENPISDHRVDQQLQWDIHKEVSNKPPFKQIKNYKIND